MYCNLVFTGLKFSFFTLFPTSSSICSTLFSLQPCTFASEEAKVAFTINHLMGRTRLWGTVEWERRTTAWSSFLAFFAQLRKVFGPVSMGPDSTGGLMDLHQGDRTVSHYAIDFCSRVTRTL